MLKIGSQLQAISRATRLAALNPAQPSPRRMSKDISAGHFAPITVPASVIALMRQVTGTKLTFQLSQITPRLVILNIL